jgi:hypothetical protein
MAINSYRTGILKGIIYFGIPALILIACYSFDTPQPHGVKPTSSIPELLHGNYTSANLNDERVFSITANQVRQKTIRNNRKFSLSKTKKIDGRYFIADDGEVVGDLVCEIIGYQVIGDSIFGSVVVEDVFLVGDNFYVFQVKDYWVIDVGIDTGDGKEWYPIFIDNFGSNFRLHEMTDEHYKTFESKDANGKESIRNLTQNDVIHLFENRSDCLKLWMEFDVQTKKYIVYK